ncbi:hypothetical protein AYI68_g8006 [Smittium mucronatum]|uniref:Uncharacterized protein n=1 Tax=Smittium mucronatum TaxID=133383 RepID=A0A1R0GM31_9FUNG|nr:hypothetical protein AYI68_g8006 [Smittium mucronatum]
MGCNLGRNPTELFDMNADSFKIECLFFGSFKLSIFPRILSCRFDTLVKPVGPKIVPILACPRSHVHGFICDCMDLGPSSHTCSFDRQWNK